MKKWYCRALMPLIVLSLSGCGGIAQQKEEQVVEETMNSSIKVDPALDLSSGEKMTVIIEFKTKPAKIAVLEAEAKGMELSLVTAQEDVEQSHKDFEKELHAFLDENKVDYRIIHRYKTAFNGVSMELPANEIKRLLGSSVISSIYPNNEIHLEPPIQPSDQM